MKKLLFLLATICCFTVSYAQQDTIIYAHRGFRGLMPENTIPAMKNALKKGADVLEMDIAFSEDRQAIVSHDPWMDSLITLDPQGNSIAKGEALPFLKMKYDLIKKYDVGTQQHRDFKKQVNFKVYIPRLADLIDSVETFANQNNLKKPWYSLETKTAIKRDHKSQPAPEEFVNLLMKVVKSKGIEDRVIIQSFDPRTLEIIHRDFPHIPTMLNVNKGTLEENLSRLTFKLDYYAPIPALIDQELIVKCQKMGIKILCGNCNDKKEIDRILTLGIDAYCTDYPYQDLP